MENKDLEELKELIELANKRIHNIKPKVQEKLDFYDFTDFENLRMGIIGIKMKISRICEEMGKENKC